MTEQLTDAPPVGSFIPLGRSKLAREIADLPSRTRCDLGWNDYLLAFVDTIVTILDAFASHDTELPFTENLLNAKSELAALDQSAEWLADALTHISDNALGQMATRLQQTTNRKAIQRLVGSATFHRLTQALTSDLHVALLGLRVIANYLRPWSAAVDASVALLTDTQKAEAQIPTPYAEPLVAAIANLEAFFDVTLIEGQEFNLDLDSAHDEPIRATASDIEALTVQFREMVTAQTDGQLADLGTTLLRKLRGARDAMEHSVDGVSQAANSLVELIDRLLRTAVPEQEVLEWVTANQLNRREFVTVRGEKGGEWPTKRAHVLCVVWGGGPIRKAAPGEIQFQSMVAFALLNARDELQRLKHADSDTPEERERLGAVLHAIEGAVLIMVRLCWSMAGRERVAVMRGRFLN